MMENEIHDVEDRDEFHYWERGYKIPSELYKTYGTEGFDGLFGYTLAKFDEVYPLRLPQCFTQWRLTDKGLSSLIAHVYKNLLAYCIEEKCWYVFNKETFTWESDPECVKMIDYVNTFTEMLRIHALIEKTRDDAQAPDEDSVKEIIKTLNKYDGVSKVNNLISMLKGDFGISVHEFDKELDYLNCCGWLYNLKTGKVDHLATGDDHCRKSTGITPTHLNRKLVKKWDEFLDDVCEVEGKVDKAKKHYLQVACGSSLFGSNPEEKMFILHGATGRNGKGVFTTAICSALGDYAANTTAGMIVDNGKTKSRSANTHTAGLSNVIHSRFLNMSETNLGERLDGAIIKSYTGGDVLQVREIYQRAYSDIPHFTMWMSVNILPHVMDLTVFTADRLRVIPFEHHHTKDEIDPNLKTLMRTPEMSAVVLKWLIDGAAKKRACKILIA